jgi:hypothetical protein
MKNGIETPGAMQWNSSRSEKSYIKILMKNINEKSAH